MPIGSVAQSRIENGDSSRRPRIIEMDPLGKEQLDDCEARSLLFLSHDLDHPCLFLAHAFSQLLTQAAVFRCSSSNTLTYTRHIVMCVRQDGSCDTSSGMQLQSLIIDHEDDTREEGMLALVTALKANLGLVYLNLSSPRLYTTVRSMVLLATIPMESAFSDLRDRCGFEGMLLNNLVIHD